MRQATGGWTLEKQLPQDFESKKLLYVIIFLVKQATKKFLASAGVSLFQTLELC